MDQPCEHYADAAADDDSDNGNVNVNEEQPAVPKIALRSIYTLPSRIVTDNANQNNTDEESENSEMPPDSEFAIAEELENAPDNSYEDESSESEITFRIYISNHRETVGDVSEAHIETTTSEYSSASDDLETSNRENNDMVVFVRDIQRPEPPKVSYNFYRRPCFKPKTYSTTTFMQQPPVSSEEKSIIKLDYEEIESKDACNCLQHQSISMVDTTTCAENLLHNETNASKEHIALKKLIKWGLPIAISVCALLVFYDLRFYNKQSGVDYKFADNL